MVRVQDFKDKFAIADKPARELTSALVLSRATPGFVTDSSRLSTLASGSSYDLTEKRYDFKQAIARAARYADVPALVDGEIVPLALEDAAVTSGGSSGSVGSGVVTSGVVTSGGSSGESSPIPVVPVKQ